MFLPDELIERLRPHPRGERRSFIDCGNIDIFFLKKLLHEGKIRCARNYARGCGRLGQSPLRKSGNFDEQTP